MIEEGYNESLENEKFLRKLDDIEKQVDEFTEELGQV